MRRGMANWLARVGIATAILTAAGLLSDPASVAPTHGETRS